MFENDLRVVAHNMPGSVAQGRHAIAKQRYLDEKKIRLKAEAEERRRQAIEEKTATLARWLSRLSIAASRLLHFTTISQNVHGR